MRALAIAGLLLLGACTPQQQQAVGAEALKVEPGLFGSCGIVETGVDAVDPAAGPIVSIACAAAEDIDGALAKLAAQGVTQVRIVCPLRPTWADAGRE